MQKRPERKLSRWNSCFTRAKSLFRVKVLIYQEEKCQGDKSTCRVKRTLITQQNRSQMTRRKKCLYQREMRLLHVFFRKSQFFSRFLHLCCASARCFQQNPDPGLAQQPQQLSTTVFKLFNNSNNS